MDGGAIAESWKTENDESGLRMLSLSFLWYIQVQIFNR
jgi:hypothetical protein